MKYELAYQSAANFAVSDEVQGFDLSEEQVAELAKRIARRVKLDLIMTPHAVLPHAEALFPKPDEDYVRRTNGRVVPPRQTRLSDDELRARVREAMDDNGMSAWGPIGDLGFVAERVFKKSYRIDKPEQIAEIARTMIKNGELHLKVHVRDAKDEAFAIADDGKWSDTGEATWLVLSAAEVGGIRMDNVTADNLVPFIKDLGRAGKLAISPRGEELERIERGKQWQADEEKKLIQNITQGRDQFSIFCKDPGRPGDVFRVQTFDSASLKGLSLDKLRELDKAANDLRRRQKLSPDDQRDDLREQADKARGHAIYREGDRTELDGAVRFSERPGARLEFVEGSGNSQAKPTADPKMDRSVPVPANLADSVIALFTDPSTKKFYTKTALHKLCRTNTSLFRKMMSTHVTFMNELLKQDN